MSVDLDAVDLVSQTVLSSKGAVALLVSLIIIGLVVCETLPLLLRQSVIVEDVIL